MAFLLAAASCSLAETNKVPVILHWGEHETLSKWHRYSYPIDSKYAFGNRLPTLEEFPKLLELPDPSSTDQQILNSQLRTLSRCNFLPWTETQQDRTNAMAKWRAWWTYHGAQQVELLKKEGRSYPEAWKAIAGSSGLPCPAYPLALPAAWSFELSFRSGDYGIMVEEHISMQVTNETASLQRRFRRSTNASWEAEEWTGLTVAESQSFLASLIYAIDHPWLYVNDNIAERPAGNLIGHIKGRPKEWSDYYPSVKWTGIRDSKGRVIIYDDAQRWHTSDHEKNPKTSFSGINNMGVVFRVIRDQFPDPT